MKLTFFSKEYTVIFMQKISHPYFVHISHAIDLYVYLMGVDIGAADAAFATLILSAGTV